MAHKFKVGDKVLYFWGDMQREIRTGTVTGANAQDLAITHDVGGKFIADPGFVWPNHMECRMLMSNYVAMKIRHEQEADEKMAEFMQMRNKITRGEL